VSKAAARLKARHVAEGIAIALLDSWRRRGLSLPEQRRRVRSIARCLRTIRREASG
jgi:hypothetical protein